MEFTGSIQFADESSWLTLTTESDDTVTIAVRVTANSFLPWREAMSFEVTPNSGIVRLPAGEILRALIGSGIGMFTGSFVATQGSSSCSHSFSVLPCRKFAYKSLAATIFTTRPKKSPVYGGAKDRLWFYRTSGDVSAYVRFNYLAGGSSSNYKLSPTYYATSKYYDLDVSCDTMLATASAKGLNALNIVSYEVWIEYSGSKSTVYSFDIRRSRLPLKTYMFLGRRGTYEYIHATGKFSRSIESETQVFVTSMIEEELANDSTMTFEQNSGHIESAGMGAYWLDFLASKKRYILEKDGSEKAIVVDEFKTSLTDRAVSSLTFTWHYANPNDTVIDSEDVKLTGLAISGVGTLGDASNKSEFSVVYTPSNTTQRAVSWSIVSGSAYASIDQKGLLTVKSGANGNAVRIRATSKENTSIYAEKTVTVTYVSLSIPVTGVSLNKSTLSLTAGGTETLVATVLPSRATDKSVTWQSSNKNVATVDQSGKVTAVSAGSAVISVKTNDGGFTATCALSVASVSGTYLRVTPTMVSLAAKSADGDVDAELTVESNQDWTVTCEADWLDLVNDSGNGDDPAFLIGTNSENTTGAVRTTSVVFTGADGTTVTVAVTQAATDGQVLPSGYTALDYIASKGVSGSLLGDLPYIDTGISDRSGHTYHVEYTVYPNSESGLSLETYPFTMGSLSNSFTGTSVKQIFTGNFPGGESSYGTTGMDGVQSGAWGGSRTIDNCITLFGVLIPGERHTLEWNYDKRFVSVDGDETSGKVVGSSASVSADGVGTSYSCYLFAVNMAGSPVDSRGNDQRRGWQKLHRLWIKDSSGTLLCDMYPCVNEAGEYGLYDTVRGTFLTSANDKTFTGPDDNTSGKTAAANASI